MTNPHSTPHPPGLRALLVQDMDFERAFEELDGLGGFHHEAMRGFIRSMQNRLAESWKHLDKAEKLSREAPRTAEVKSQIFLLRLYATATAVMEEAMAPGGDSVEKTDEVVAHFSELEEPQSFVHDRMRITQISYYNLIRGDFELARETFEFLLEKLAGQFDDQLIGIYCGAAAATKELGYDEVAERHYENAHLGFGMITLPLRTATYAARLYTLMSHWGRDEEAKAWLAKIEALDCPEASRGHFLDRARFLTAASRARDSIFIA